MTRSRKNELCNHCKHHHRKYQYFDGGVFYLMVDKCKKGNNVHSLEPECDDFECNLKYKIKNIFVRW